jgi:PT repeat family protein
MKRRLFSLFLALTLVVGMLPAPAFAQETESTQATQAPTEASTPTEAPRAEPTQAPTEAPTEAPAAEPAQPVTEAQPTEPPVQAFSEPARDEDVAAVQAMIDALPDVSHMSESYLDALEAAYSAFEALSEAQQAQINGVEKLEALFGWVNSQVSTLAEDVMEISGEVKWNNQTITKPVKLIGDTTLTLVGDNKIECDAPLDLNSCTLTIKGTGTLEVVGDGRSKEYQCNGAIFDSTYTGRTASAGTLILESGTVKTSGGTHNAISLYAVDLKGGSLEAYGGVRSGLACSYLYARSGSLYATGGKYGIYAAVFRGACNPGNLPILASDEKDASMAEMDEGNLDDINDNAKKKTYYIGKVSGPMLSVKAQEGHLYEGLDNQKVTFAISRKNISGYQVETSWVGDHQGLDHYRQPASVLNVTADATVKQGTYYVKFEVVDYSGTEAKVVLTKTVTVTVLGAPITVTTQPQDASASCKGGDLDSWQGDKKIQVAGTLATGLTDPITYQWKLEGDTELDGFNQSTISLKNLYSDKKLTPQTDKPWLSSAKVYCTLTVGTYSVDTKTVTLTVNTCNYQRVNHVDGKCLQCGEFHTSDPLLVSKDGYFAVVPDESGDPSMVGGHLVGGGTFFLTKDVTHRDLNAGNATKDNKDTILDLQGHTLESLNMGNFPYGSFTLKNGTLNQCIRSTATEGKLILDGVTFGDACWQAASNDYLDITVRGDTVFQANVSFSVVEGVVHLRGGTFKEGIDTSNGAKPLALLDDGFAFQSDRGIVDASNPENLSGKTIQVVAHTCKYVNGKCECGRTCDHKTVDADGYCTVCHALVEPYAIGQNRYKSLEEALTAAKDGETITLRGDFYQGSKTVEINKNVTLELGEHTLTGDADGEPVLRVLAENVTIRNGTVENTRTAKSSPAVTVGETVAAAKAGLTVKSVTFIGSSDGNAPQEDALDIQNGHAKVESGIFNGGIFAQGDLTMTGGSATRLELGYVMEKVELSGGSFDSISFNANPNYLGLLAKGYAYQSGTSLVKLADMDSNTAVQVVKCTHPDGLTATDECPYCGKKCGHGNINQTTGLCPDCGYQAYRAKIGDTLYETAQAALDAATDRQRVTLLADDTLPDNYVLDKVITLDMNSKKLTGSAMTVTGEVTVPSSGSLDVPMEITGKLTLNGPAATLLQDVSVRASGTLILDRSTAAATGTISVYENGRFELRDGSIGKLRIDGGTATLSAGRIMRSVTVKNGNLQSILAEGKALLLKADGTVIDGTRSAALGNMEIVDHTHTFGEGGKCACGAVAPVQVEAGTESIYYGDFESAVNKAVTLSGSTVRLRDNVTHSGDSGIYINSGTFTIDWNGHTLSGSLWGNLLTISGPANVTLTDGSGTNTGGARHTGYAAAVCFAVGSEGRVNIQGGTYFPNVTRSQYGYGSVQISGGVFENTEGCGQTFALYDLGDRPLSQMLAPDTAFAYDKDGSELLNAYNANKPDNYRTVYAVAHTHESFDENGVCACGYTCPHENWTDGVCDLCGKTCDHEEWKNGKCTVCGYPCPHEDVTENGGVYTCDICGLTMTVMVETADGNVSYTTDLAAALNDAEDGTTVKLLSDLVLTKSAYIEDGKEVTLNLNGHNITRATWQTIQVKGNTGNGTKTKLVITGSGEIRFNVKAADGGQLDMSGWTGTAAGVDLENACDFVGPTGNGHLDALNISNWRSDNKGTILLQGGTIGQLWLNSFENFQMTLGSLLKPGYAAKSGSEYLPYDHAISQSDNTLNNLTIVPCPHTGLDSSGRCTYCNAIGFVATVTKNGVTAGYTDFLSALDEICDGKRGTLKLLKDVPVEEGYLFGRISGILDLNGKNLACELTCIQGSNLQIVNRGSGMSGMGKLEVWNGAKVTIADTAGSILFDMVTVESGSVADLLPEGGAYITHDGTWISAADAAAIRSLDKVAVKKPPVKSVTLIANKTTVPYGESQTVTLTASSTQSEGVTPSYAWAEVKSDGTVQTFPEEVGTSFTLPAGVNAGEHTYRVSVTVGDYTLSKDIQITVTKAKGTLENKDYRTEFTYGQTVPTPKAENFTTNNPDGTFSYHWKTGNNSGLEPGANPVDAGTYMLYATWTGGTNYTTASLSLAVTIQKAAQTANIAVVNETISGKGDGGVNLLPSAEGYEMRKKGETTFEPIPASQGQTFMTLTPGVTYEIRLAETKNYQPTAPQEVTVQPGRKLTVTLPDKQEGYTLTASKTQLDWHEDVVLTFKLNPVGAYKAADFGVWKQEGSSKIGLPLGTGGAVTLNDVSNDITITVTGVKTDNVAPKVYIQGRMSKDSFDYVKWEGFQENPADDFVNGNFAIAATDRLSGVASLWYCLSKTPLTRADMDTASWKKEDKVSITEDGVYYLYAKALDKANNAGYACTGKLVKESNPPTFSGVKDGETYYVTQQMEIHDDGMPDWYMAKGSIGVVPNGGDENPIKLKLKNDGRPYTITAGDRCGNEATITVYMKPLSDLTQPLDRIQEETIRKSDRATLDEVEATLKGLDVTYAFEQEKKEIQDKLAEIARLRAVLDQVAAVEAQIGALPDSVEPYQQTVEDTQIKPARKAYSDLTDHQKTLVDSTKLAKLEKLEAQLNAWTITEGDGQTWYKGSGKSLSFTVNGQSRKFDGIRQENTYIGCGVSSLLTASGEMDKPFTLTLKPAFLQCQTPGEHSFTVYYSGDLSISVTYTVETPTNYLDVTDREEFEGKTTVTVDGKEYPIEEMAGYLQRIPTQRYVNLPETGDLLTIYSFKDGTPTDSYTNYPMGMQVFRITRQEGGAKAEEITEFANLLNYAGCSIRVSGKKGIRMITGIDQNVKKSLVSKAGLAGYTLEEYGTVVQWADTLGSNTLNLDNSNKKNYAYKKGKADPIFAKENGMIQYTNVLVGFTDAQCQPDLVMRPYIKLIDTATGETVTLYGGSVTRSIGYVAWQNRDTYKQGTASYKYVWNIINSVDTSKYPN